MKNLTKRIFWSAVVLGLAWLLYRSFQPVPVLVDVATVSRGTLRVTVDDDGRTRVRERYTISAPVPGRLLRVPLDPGDALRAGETPVAEIVPVVPDLLDARTKAELEAHALRAEAALSAVEARREQADAEAGFARAELDRARELHAQGTEPRRYLEEIERNERRARQGARAAEFTERVARYELEVARASLFEPESPTDPKHVDGTGVARRGADGRLRLRSPIDGTVLRVFEESARTVAAGTPVLEIGNTAALEIVADYLSQDAVMVAAGMPVLVEGWGGGAPGEKGALRGRVRVVEPGGFTKVSALGVEEQRVNIIVDPQGEPEDWGALGDGYRVELRIVLWEQDDVLLIPTGALFRDGEAWAVFVVDDGRAKSRHVELGRRNGLEAQVTEGLVEGERVVLYPSELLDEGVPVETR